MLKLTTDKHETSRGLSATAELLVFVRTDIWATVQGIVVKFRTVIHIRPGRVLSDFWGWYPEGLQNPKFGASKSEYIENGISRSVTCQLGLDGSF